MRTQSLRLRRPHQPPDAAERLVDQRPEQQQKRQGRDRANQAVRPEHLHVAAGADHRQPERVLGAGAKHQRQGERRQGDADLLEDITDHAESQHTFSTTRRLMLAAWPRSARRSSMVRRISLMPNRPITATRKLMPRNRSVEPKVMRNWPDTVSLPTPANSH